MNSQIELILEKSAESLSAAQLLFRQDYFDFAASRAYYSMFYTAEALLLSRNLSFSSHPAVLAAFGKEFSKTGDLDSKFHKLLIAAQDYRSQGDYSFTSGVTRQSAQDTLIWAEEFLEAAKTYLAGT